MLEEEQGILDAIEYSPFMYSGVEGVMEVYEHRYVKGIITPSIATVELNKVGMARIPDNAVEETIEEVVNYFSKQGVNSIGWMLSPQSLPKNLASKLEDFGFQIEIPVWGMTRSIEEQLEISVSDEFEFQFYNNEEAIDQLKREEVLRMGEKAYGFPEGAGIVYRLLFEGLKTDKFSLYVAYEKEENKPVAYSAIFYIPETKIARLSGAATLQEYRGKGIYSGMLKLRYDQAKRDGIENLVLQAMEATSAPIAAKYGFKKVCELPYYVWKIEK